MTGLEWLSENVGLVRGLCRKSCRGRLDLVSDLFAVAVDRVDRIYEMWDHERPLWPYMRKNLRWYMWKFLNKQARRQKRERVLPEDPRDAVKPQEYCDWMETVLGRLSSDDRRIIEMKLKEDMIFGDIARSLGVAKGTAVKRYQDAIERAIAVAQSMET